MKFALIVLAYNESKTIEEVIKKHETFFDKIIVVNDKSKDNTHKILSGLENDLENLTVITNSKNLGAGKSFDIGIKEFLQSDCDYVVKIDGDGQFNPKDAEKIKILAQEKNLDFIKCDRFWVQGINGKIPLIRYFGNAFASFLIKFATGNWKINDALNGLFLISRKVADNFALPKLFNRYGYPFYLNTYVSNYAMVSDIKIGQYKNVINYGEEKSSLNPFTMFFKLIYFVVINFITKIKIKVRISELQLSAILDILSIVIFSNLIFSLYKFIGVRYLDSSGPQDTWYLVVIIYFLVYLGILTLSQNQESKFNKDKFLDMK